jgi:hemolysin activation/secretion protein
MTWRIIFLFLAIIPISLTPVENKSAKKQLEAAPNADVAGRKGIMIEGFSLVKGGTNLDDAPRKHGIHVYFRKGDYDKLEDELSEYLNRQMTNKVIDQVKKTIVDYFRFEKDLYVAAIIPVQKIINGVIVIQVIEGHIGNIEYKGQRWFSEHVLKRELAVSTGSPIIESNLLNAVTWANRNPFHMTKMVFIEGKNVGTTDITFQTKDKFPVRVFAGVDNTGFKTTDQVRLYCGANWGNALGFGDILSYQYTASPDFHKFQSHVLSYTSFLSWQHFFTVFGNYGTIFPQIPNFKSDGVNYQVSARYKIPIKPLYGSFRSYTELGFDWIYLNSNLFFEGDVIEAFPTSNQSMEITQFILEYQCERNWPTHLLTFKFNMYVSPWKDLFPYQSSTDYKDQRAGSHVKYIYWKALIGDTYRSPKRKWVFDWKLRGQLSMATLPTAQQFALGGSRTVRGYHESQFVADNAICLNMEFYAPTLKPFKEIPNELAFLAFLDCGYGYNYSTLSSSLREQTLVGIGPGVRFKIGSYLSAKLDYGFQAIGIVGDDIYGRINFSLTASY